MKKSHLLICTILFSLVCILVACSPTNHQKMILQPCLLGDISAQCGTLTVFEDRATNEGRKINIHVAVIKARGPNPAPDPIFYLAGGPGASAIDDAAYAMLMLKSANERRDLVLVDQRGTGKSNRLVCPREVEQSIGMIPIDDQQIQDLRDCLAELDADPGAYTTAWGMDDLDEIRAALGYERINLYGESYGPTAEQVYLQRHGEHVRTMTLEGASLLDVPIFEQLPRSSQEALELLFARCRADSACNSAYPSLSDEVTEVLARLENQPAELPLIHPRTGLRVRISRDMMVLAIHSLLAGTETTIELPRLIHQAYQGDWSGIADLASPIFSSDSPMAEWRIMNLTILCHEDWARTRREETTQLSDGAYMEYEDVRRLTVPEQVCAVIPRPQPESLYQPVTSSPVPVLIINNQADPQDPPESVAGAKEHYPNSLVLIAPWQSHGYSGFNCRDRIISSFIENGSVQDLDTECLQQQPLLPFDVGD